MVLARERASLHPPRRLDPGQAQYGRRQIDETNQPVRRSTWFIVVRGQVLPLLREVNDQRHVQSRVVGPALAPRHAGSVVAVVENDRIFGKVGVVKLFQVLANPVVQHRDAIVVLRPVAPHFGRVGMVGWQARLRRIVKPVCVADRIAKLRLVRDRVIEDGEERLAVLSILPMGLAIGRVPHRAGLGQVVVLLAIIGAVVAGVSQELRIHPKARGQVDIRPHVLRARGGRIQSGNNSRACRGADRRVGNSVGVEHPTGCQSVKVWRHRVIIAVAAEMRPVVFASDPQEVGQVRSA